MSRFIQRIADIAITFITVIFCLGVYTYAQTVTTVQTQTIGDASGWSIEKGWYQEVNDRLLTISMPSGAIMAFNTGSCPTGWTTFSSANGRVIVGVGSDGQGNTYSLLNVGGEARHILSINEMPSHNHSIYARDVFNPSWAFLINDHSGDSIVSSDNSGDASNSSEARPNHYYTEDTGGSQSHENRMPYLALLYCQKQ